MRISLVMAAIAVLAAGMAAQASTGARGSTSKLGCKLAGPRFFGAAAGKASVCFTLSSDLKTMREYAFDVCKASKIALSSSAVRKNLALKADGTFSNVSSALAAGEAGLGFVNITFSGRVKGNLATGSLTLKAVDTGSTFRCAWAAHRTSG
jgi:hypothetical protein